MRRILVFGFVALVACGSSEAETVGSSRPTSTSTTQATAAPSAAIDTATAMATATAESSASAEPADGSPTAVVEAPDVFGSQVPVAGSVSGDVVSLASASASASVTKADPSRLVLKNKPIQGGVVFAKVDGKVGRIMFPGHRAVVSDDGEFPIAFFRNAPKTEKMTIHFKDGSVLEHLFEVEQRTYDTDKIDGLPENMVKLDMETRKKLAVAEAKIDKVRMKYGKTNCYKDGFKWPTLGKVTSRYGQPRVLNGIPSGIHWGVDIAVPIGTAVKAPACGTVVFAEADLPLSGGTLVIDHGHGLTTTFIHLSGFSKKVGDAVKPGELVARSGQSGRTTGAHLHWSANYFEVRVDPELLAGPMPGTKK